MTSFQDYPTTRRPSPIPMLLAGAAFVMAAWMLIERSGVLTRAPSAEPRAVTARGELAPLEQTMISVFEQASPSVAHITTRALVRDMWGSSATQEGSGSGFVWDDRGTVVTNYHVVKGARTVKVAVGDKTMSADVIGSSSDYDLAVLRLNGDIAGLRPLQLGTSKDLRVGQTAIAIGNPFGFDQTMTTGIVSALNRNIQTRESKTLSGVIQVDAAINPGNSGGPLLDSAGRLIGVTTAIYSPTGANAGIGFAVPVDTVNEVVPQLLGAAVADASALANMPVLGVRNQSGFYYCAVDVPGYRSGAIFTALEPGFGAALAGLRPFTIEDDGTPTQWGDVIVAIDDVRVRSYVELGNALRGKQRGQTVAVKLVRGMPDAPHLDTVSVKLGKGDG